MKVYLNFSQAKTEVIEIFPIGSSENVFYTDAIYTIFVRKIWLLTDKGRRELYLAEEIQIDVILNDRLISRIMCSPERVEDLVMGYMISEGIIERDDDIEIEQRGWKVYVNADNVNPDFILELRSSGCVGVSWVESEENKIESDSRYRFEVVKNSLPCLDVEEYTLTHGYHVACLFHKNGRMIDRAIDIGRHNAVDKTIGAGIRNNIDLSSCFLIISGRISRGIAMKCVRANIPLIATKAAFIESAVSLAEKTNLTMVSFQKNCTAVVNPWRFIDFSSE